MHTTEDKPNGILINHNGGWIGQVRIAWYVASEERHRECWCNGADLVAGRFTPTSGPPGESAFPDPPVNVLTRAVALAVEGFLRAKMERALDDLFIRRGKL